MSNAWQDQRKRIADAEWRVGQAELDLNAARLAADQAKRRHQDEIESMRRTVRLPGALGVVVVEPTRWTGYWELDVWTEDHTGEEQAPFWAVRGVKEAVVDYVTGRLDSLPTVPELERIALADYLRTPGPTSPWLPAVVRR